MRILLLAEEFYPSVSGGARTRWEFCTGAVTAGHDVTAFTPQRDDLPDSEIIKGVRIERPASLRLPGTDGLSSTSTMSRLLLSPLFFFATLWTLHRSDIDPDVIVSTSNSMHWMAWVLQRLLGVKATNFIGYSPIVHPDRHSHVRLLLAKANIRLFHAELILCRSHSVKSYVQSATDCNVRIVHGIVDGELIRDTAASSQTKHREELSVPSDGCVLAFVGRLVPIKRPLATLEILTELDDDFHLVIVGDGPLRDAIQRAVVERGLENRVTLTGEVPPAKALQYIACADGLVVTSEAESYCSVALEALALGRPVFTTPVGVLNQITHPNLHSDTLNNLAKTIRKTSMNCSLHVDTDIVSRYSMTRFTDDFLAELSRYV
ncbi:MULTISPECIES: glycosyltransferase family 4 protein [Haloarcula]|uniref:glycosyltransferase family 4 protein n=1 Tax=Haloarcula TaxID=2237 RepID=UPI0023EBE99A|nr:glycosyltransferase family 4 protein [Halomicroarcula sp. XH51]